MTVFGLKNSKAQKLTQSEVEGLRDLYEQGATQGELARKFHVSVGQIGRIVRGESRQGGRMPPEATRQELDAIAQRLMKLQERRDLELAAQAPAVALRRAPAPAAYEDAGADEDEGSPTGLAKLQAVAADQLKGGKMLQELEGEVLDKATAYLGRPPRSGA